MFVKFMDCFCVGFVCMCFYYFLHVLENCSLFEDSYFSQTSVPLDLRLILVYARVVYYILNVWICKLLFTLCICAFC